MKSVAVSVICLLSTSEATFRSIKQQFTGVARALGNRNLVGSFLDDFNGYGCWCYLEENPNGAVERTGIGYGKSSPVNAYDALCKVLHGGYECIVADQASAGQACEPWLVPYTIPASSCLNTNGAVTCCNQVNTPNSCAALACIVERQFVIDMFDVINQGIPTNVPTFGHDNGFDQAGAGCPITKGVRNPTTACCGVYPERYPFKTLNGARQCCESNGVAVTFMAAAWDCCSDGVGPNGCP